MKKLGIKKETLAELTSYDLRGIVAAGHESHSCTPTYTCVSAGDCDSFVCTRMAEPVLLQKTYQVVVVVTDRVGC